MKKRVITLVLILASLLCACQTSKIDDNNIVTEKQTSSDSIKEEIDKLFDYVSNDKVGDKSTVVWSNNKAYTEKDMLDDLNIDDGKEIEIEPKKYIEENVMSIEYPSEFEIIQSTSKNIHLYSDKSDMDIILTKQNYTDAVKEFSDYNYIECDRPYISEYNLSYFEDYKKYVGVKQIDNEYKAGFVFIFNADSEDRTYSIEVYGTGSLNNIEDIASLVMNSFSFEYDWNDIDLEH